MPVRRICVVTGTRAEYGILSGLLRKLQKDPQFELQLLVTGAHLAPEFGLTISQIEKDGFSVTKKIEMLLSSDSNVGTVKSMGLGLIGYADALEDIKPHIVLMLGDRYEIFAVATAAMILKIPIVHLHGGEITQGAFDESLRHAITKMSHLHFTSTEVYRRRVIQLGEDPQRVFNVGALGVENIHHLKPMTKQELSESLQLELKNKIILVTFHPVTLENQTAASQLQEVFEGLKEFLDYQVIFTLPNADPEGRGLMEQIKCYAEENPSRVSYFASLGARRYLSLLSICNVVLGNSSSGIIETPSFKVPTVNIGNRQGGRVKAQSVIDCLPYKASIVEAINLALSKKFKEICLQVKNPYEQADTTEQIIGVLKNYPFENGTEKVFYDFK
jgi:UDP-hydrolysing UDP-N-acetyl-D-glucosamine 2-epimerase